jgi:hypothetical protein
MKPEFRSHLTKFALYQLPLLLVYTVKSVRLFLVDAGIISERGIGQEESRSTMDRLTSLGKVPLVHAYEWNLTPNGVSQQISHSPGIPSRTVEVPGRTWDVAQTQKPTTADKPRLM